MSRVRHESGFSLIEVLIAVLVLALGLLGLGAIFPAVIAQQRDAFNASRGADAADMAIDLLSNSDPEVLDVGTLWQTADNNRLALGTVNLNGGAGSRPVRINEDNRTNGWIVSTLAEANSGQLPGVRAPLPVFDVSRFGDLQTGMWRLDALADANDYKYQLPVQSRLVPLPDSGADPRFVWDPVVRLIPGERVQVAIFVRQIDQRIRVPRGFSLSDVLTDDNSVPRIDRPVLPIALDPARGRTVTDDGRSATSVVYPVPFGVEVGVYEDHLDWLVFDDEYIRSSGTPDDRYNTTISLLRRVGQQFVDNTGVVRTVVGLPEVEPGGDDSIARRAVIVEPAFTLANATEGRRPSARNPDAVQRSTWVTQAVFTPQIPVAVRVYTLDRPGSN